MHGPSITDEQPQTKADPKSDSSSETLLSTHALVVVLKSTNSGFKKCIKPSGGNVQPANAAAKSTHAHTQRRQPVVHLDGATEVVTSEFEKSFFSL